ncbi:MAG: biotin/lipoate A/B protein ligase family protein [Thermosphaera sp.]
MSLRTILDLEGRDAYWQMAIDEALLNLRLSGAIPDTLRIYRFKPSAVTIGYFQAVRDSVNLDYLNAQGIHYTRRITGGGAVYHDSEGELTYSVVMKITGDLRDVMESYRILCSGLVRALRYLGVEAEFAPINDIVVKGRKISGSAQTRRKDTLLQHGTLMYATNVDVLEKALIVPSSKLETKGVRSIRDRVITLREAIGEVDVSELAAALVKGFSEALGRQAYVSGYGEQELEAASKLREKYLDPKWIFRR